MQEVAKINDENNHENGLAQHVEIGYFPMLGFALRSTKLRKNYIARIVTFFFVLQLDGRAQTARHLFLTTKKPKIPTTE